MTDLALFQADLFPPSASIDHPPEEPQHHEHHHHHHHHHQPSSSSTTSPDSVVPPASAVPIAQTSSSSSAAAVVSTPPAEAKLLEDLVMSSPVRQEVREEAASALVSSHPTPVTTSDGLQRGQASVPMEVLQMISKDLTSIEAEQQQQQQPGHDDLMRQHAISSYVHGRRLVEQAAPSYQVRTYLKNKEISCVSTYTYVIN